MGKVRGLALILLVLIFIGIFICLFDLYVNSFDSEMQTVITISQGERISGTFLRGDVTKSRGVILLHDKGYDRTSMTALASAFNKEGYHVLYYDMPGHGLSEGKFKQQYYTNDRLTVILDDITNQMMKISELDVKDISYAGIGLGATTILNYSSKTDVRNDLYLLSPYAQRNENFLTQKKLVEVGRKDNVLLVFSNTDKEYTSFVVPKLYEDLTNETFDPTNNRNISLLSNVEVAEFDAVPKILQPISNGIIKKVIFTASMKQGFELRNDYFNTRSIIYFLVLIMIIIELYLINRAFLPNIPSTKVKKSPYEYGIKRLLLSFVVIGIYIGYSIYFSDKFKINLKPLYENLLVIFLAYGITGLFSLKFKKVVRLGDNGILAAVSIVLGIFLLGALALWLFMGVVSLSFIETKLVYFGIVFGCTWFGFYFYALDFSVMYMMGASKSIQKFLTRLVFFAPIIVILIMSYIKGSEDIIRDVLQYALIFVSLYLCEGLQRIGNKILYSSFFGAALYSAITLIATMYI